MLASTPVLAVTYSNPIQASLARCEQLAGREKDRCESIHRRVQRLRLRQTANTYDRGNTMREQRVLRTTTQSSNIRRINEYDMNRLRRYDTNGVNPRRLIRRRDEEARSKCDDLEGTESTSASAQTGEH